MKRIRKIDGSKLAVTLKFFGGPGLKQIKRGMDPNAKERGAAFATPVEWVIINGTWFKKIVEIAGEKQAIKDLCKVMMHEFTHQSLACNISRKASAMLDNLYYDPKLFKKRKHWGLLDEDEMTTLDKIHMTS